VKASDIKLCSFCDYGPLAWVKNASGKWVLAMIYVVDGRLIANAQHVHLPRACGERQVAEQRAREAALAVEQEEQ